MEANRSQHITATPERVKSKLVILQAPQKLGKFAASQTFQVSHDRGENTMAEDDKKETENAEDPMEKYYGQSALKVADGLFGENWEKSGVFYSAVDDDIPYRIEGLGNGKIRDINLFSGEPDGSRGLEGVVVSKLYAENLLNS